MQSMFRDYIELTKPRILMMQWVTVSMGFFMAAHTKPIAWGIFFFLLLGTGLVSAGAGVLNHYLERSLDAQMKRTQNRPIPRGSISARSACIFGVILAIGGLWVLWVKTNWLTTLNAAATIGLYLWVYTPMKRKTWLNTFMGAIPGALPPLGGWAAATGSLGMGGIILGMILFMWQHPHFYSIAILYKEDYAKAGFKMLPVIDPTGVVTNRQILWYTCLLIACTFLPVLYRSFGILYFMGSVVLGIWMFRTSLAMVRDHSAQQARRLLRVSVIYLPLLLILMVCDVVIRHFFVLL